MILLLTIYQRVYDLYNLKAYMYRSGMHIFMWMCVVKDMAKREDLRHLTVCSVDPPGCTDIDDALHCRELDNGNLEVHIHYKVTVVSYLCLYFHVSPL